MGWDANFMPEPTYIHPQPDLSKCADCGAVPSMTAGDTEYMMFCPVPQCLNIGVRRTGLNSTKMFWNDAQVKGVGGLHDFKH